MREGKIIGFLRKKGNGLNNLIAPSRMMFLGGSGAGNSFSLSLQLYSSFCVLSGKYHDLIKGGLLWTNEINGSISLVNKILLAKT